MKNSESVGEHFNWMLTNSEQNKKEQPRLFLFINSYILQHCPKTAQNNYSSLNK